MKRGGRGKGHSVCHFRVFCALCHKHAFDAKRRNLDDKITPIILDGYRASNSYKMYDPITQNMSINKYVAMDEGSSWDW